MMAAPRGGAEMKRLSQMLINRAQAQPAAEELALEGGKLFKLVLAMQQCLPDVVNVVKRLTDVSGKAHRLELRRWLGDLGADHEDLESVLHELDPKSTGNIPTAPIHQAIAHFYKQGDDAARHVVSLMGPTSRILSFMRSLDTDGDGVLSRSELRRGLGEMGVSTEMVYLSVI
jgi:hypothetical protein